MDFSVGSLSVQGNFNPLWIVLGALGAGFLGWWAYRSTNPPVSPTLRWLLTSLRSLTLMGALWLVWQPVLIRRWIEDRKPLIAFVVDRSLSMGVSEDGVTRWEKVQGIFTRDAFKSVKEKSELIFFSLGDTLQGPYSSPGWEGQPKEPLTDIGGGLSAIESIARQRGLDGVVLVSDGIATKGPDPLRVARRVRVPIWAIGVGSEAPVRDLSVSGIEVSPIVYQGNKVPIKVNLRATEAQGQRTQVTIRDNLGQTVYTQIWDIRSPFEEKEVVAEFIPREVGKVRMEVDMDPIEGERNRENNRRSFFLNVLQSRMKVLLLGGAPDSDLGDLLRRLSADPDLHIITRILKGTVFYEGDWPPEDTLKTVEAVLLHHFPPGNVDRNAWGRLVRELERLELPLILIDGGKLEVKLLEGLTEFLPVEPTMSDGLRKRGEVAVLSTHSIVAQTFQETGRGSWTGLPPLSYREGRWRVKGGGEVLLAFTPRDGTSSPMLVIWEKGNMRSAAILAEGIWRWGLAGGRDNNIWEQTLNRLIRWITLRRSLKRVNLQLDKEEYTTGEPIILRVMAYDANFNPQDGLEIEVQIKPDEGEAGQFFLNGKGRGSYQGEFSPWKEGLWRIKAIARREGALVGEDSTAIIVEPFSVEYLELRMNRRLLEAIGDITGGGFAPVGQSDSLLNAIPLRPEKLSRESHYVLWGKSWLFILLIGFLTLEWLIRMRKGML